MSFWRKPVEQGVKAGLETVFGEGGSFSKMMAEGMAPIRVELARLRKIERRYQWHPIAKVPDWVKAEPGVLLSEGGEPFFGCWREPEGDDEGYWDRDIEYGGSACDPSHFYLLQTPPRGTTERPSEPRVGPIDPAITKATGTPALDGEGGSSGAGRESSASPAHPIGGAPQESARAQHDDGKDS